MPKEFVSLLVINPVLFFAGSIVLFALLWRLPVVLRIIAISIATFGCSLLVMGAVQGFPLQDDWSAFIMYALIYTALALVGAGGSQFVYWIYRGRTAM